MLNFQNVAKRLRNGILDDGSPTNKNSAPLNCKAF